jgi:hypothetical protein
VSVEGVAILDGTPSRVVRLFVCAWCDVAAEQPVLRVAVRYADLTLSIETLDKDELPVELLDVHPLARAANEWAKARLQEYPGFEGTDYAVLCVLPVPEYGVDCLVSKAGEVFLVRCAGREGVVPHVERLLRHIVEYVCDVGRAAWKRVAGRGAL